MVKSTKHVANPELLAPLPLHNLTHPGSAGQSSSPAIIPCHTAQDNLLATSPPAEFASENEKLLPEERFSHQRDPRGKKGKALVAHYPGTKKSRRKAAIYSVQL